MRWLAVAIVLLVTPAWANEWVATKTTVKNRCCGLLAIKPLLVPPIVRVTRCHIQHAKKPFAALRKDDCPQTTEPHSLRPLSERPLENLWRRIDGSMAMRGPVHFGYAAPTDRYPHGALGAMNSPFGFVSGIEFTRLFATKGILQAESATLPSFTLPKHQVFEDRVARDVDLDGFGTTEIVTIIADVSLGASVAVFGLRDNALKLLAQTPYIGTPNRWLNIAGIDDFDGSGSASIALVRTPHIGGTLQFWRWSTASGKPRLTKTAELFGFSNHKYGDREQRLSAVEDFDNDGVSDLALPSANRRSLKLVRLSGMTDPQIEIMAEVPLPSPIDKAIGVTRDGDDVVLTVGLEDGSVYAIHREMPDD